MWDLQFGIAIQCSKGTAQLQQSRKFAHMESLMKHFQKWIHDANLTRVKIRGKQKQLLNYTPANHHFYNPLITELAL